MFRRLDDKIVLHREPVSRENVNRSRFQRHRKLLQRLSIAQIPIIPSRLHPHRLQLQNRVMRLPLSCQTHSDLLKDARIRGILTRLQDGQICGATVKRCKQWTGAFGLPFRGVYDNDEPAKV